MSSVIRLGIGIIAVTTVGWLATSLAGMRPGRYRYERIALWFLFGTGLLTIVAFWVSLLAARYGPLASSVLASLGLLVSATAIYRSRKELIPLTSAYHRLAGWWRAKPFPWPTAGILFALGAAVCAVAVITFGTELGWDGVAIWGLKGRAFFVDGGVSRSYFHDLSRQWSHLDYPLLVPLMEAWIYTVLGSVNEELVKVLFFAFYVSLLCLFCGAVRRENSLLYSMAFTLVLCLTPAMLTMGTTGFADLPLTTFVFAGSANLYFWFRYGRSENLVLAGLLSALAIWTKREGSVLWLLYLVSVTVWLVFACKQSAMARVRLLLRFLFPAALLVPWYLFLMREQVPSNDFAPLTLQGFLSNMNRLPILGRILITEVFSTSHWGILWSLFLLGLIFPSPRSLTASDLFLFLLPVTYLLLMTGTYVFSLWNPFEDHVLNSLDRLVLQVAPLALLFVAQRLSQGVTTILPTSIGRALLGSGKDH